MKSWPFFVVLVAGGTSLCGQGTVLFNNYVPAAGIYAPVFRNIDGGPLTPGSGFVAQLYATPAGTPISSLQPVGLPVSFGDGPLTGYLDQSADLIRAIPNVPAGSPVFVEMRVWSVNGGTTWEQAYHSGRWDVLINWGGGIQVTAGDAGHPTPMVGLVGFGLLPAALVPEPSTGWLLLAGASALWWRGRKLRWPAQNRVHSSRFTRLRSARRRSGVASGSRLS